MDQSKARTELVNLSMDLSASELRLVTGGGWKKFTKGASKVGKEIVDDTVSGGSKMVEETGDFFAKGGKWTGEVILEETEEVVIEEVVEAGDDVGKFFFGRL